MREVRKKKGWTVCGAASFAGVSEVTLLRWESGAEPKRTRAQYHDYCAKLGVVHGPVRHYTLVADAIDRRDLSPWSI